MMRRFRTYPQIGGKRGGIPSGWVELKYLMFTGSQYIIIPVTSGSVTNFTTKIRKDTSNTNEMDIVSAYGQTGKFTFGYYNGNYFVYSESSTNVVVAEKPDFVTLSVELNNVSKVKSISAYGLTSSGSFVVIPNFSSVTIGRRPDNRNYLIASVEYISIVVDGAEKYKLVGVRNATTDEVAMCDVLTGDIYRNAGTGAFVAGPDKGALVNPYQTADEANAHWEIDKERFGLA